MQFFANPDDTHCFQACLRMLFSKFAPSNDYSWSQLDEISGKKSGKWTWPLRAIGELSEMGLVVEVIDDFDYPQFISRAESYLIERFGPEAGAEQINNSDIPYEVEVARKYSHLVSRIGAPTIDELRAFVSRGMLPICCLNLPALYGQPGYLGHFILVVSVTDGTVILNDPGISTPEYPGKEGVEVSIDAFQQAWVVDRFVFAVGAASQRI